MRTVATAFLVAAAMVIRTEAQAIDSFTDGNKLYEECSDKDASIGAAICLGYIRGVADVIFGRGVYGSRACAASGVTVGQIRDVVVKHLKDNPKDRHYTAVAIIADALEAAFPCRK